MKFTIASTSVLSLFLSVVVGAETIKYKFKENSNKADIETYWKTDPSCVEFNSFSIYATDGYFKAGGEDKTIIKEVYGSATLYSNCKESGANRLDVNFYSSELVSGLVFSQLKNVTIDATLSAYVSKSKCVIQSYDFFEFEPELLSYYVCGDVVDSSTRPMSIKMVIAPETDFSNEYTSIEKGVTRAPGFLVKYETNSRCKFSVATKNVITLGKKNPIVFETDTDSEAFSYGKICKVKSGSSTRIKFTTGGGSTLPPI